MTSFGWVNAPSPVRSAVDTLQQAIQQMLGENLLGIYLHGSLALGCFNPDRSDLDILVCTGESMAVETKRAVALALLHLSASPYPIEISFLRRQDVQPWQFPTPFDFHYSEMWRSLCEAEPSSRARRIWDKGPIRRDSDLAAHITVARKRGITLFGLSADHAFPAVPPADYLTAILVDCAAASARIVAEPIYGVLTLCRVYAYVLEACICSKDEAGVWGSEIVPPPLKRVVQHALAAYRSEPEDEQFGSDELGAFAVYMNERIQATTPAWIREISTPHRGRSVS